MDTVSDIDTIQMGYEETDISTQSTASHTSGEQGHYEVQEALSLATMLQRLRDERLNGDTAIGGM